MNAAAAAAPAPPAPAAAAPAAVPPAAALAVVVVVAAAIAVVFFSFVSCHSGLWVRASSNRSLKARLLCNTIRKSQSEKKKEEYTFYAPVVFFMCAFFTSRAGGTIDGKSRSNAVAASAAPAAGDSLSADDDVDDDATDGDGDGDGGCKDVAAVCRWGQKSSLHPPSRWARQNFCCESNESLYLRIFIIKFKMVFFCKFYEKKNQKGPTNAQLFDSQL